MAERAPATTLESEPHQPAPVALSLVLCNAPPDGAETIARAIIDQRLAACVNIVPGIVSLYWWEGAVSRDAESTLLIKTRTELVARLTDAIRAVHPYSVPEVIAVRIEPGQGNPDYAAWVCAETAAAAPASTR